LGHPIVNDRGYGRGWHNQYFAEHYGLTRMVLHAHRLTFVHPFTAARVTITALPSDLAPGFAALGVDPRHYDA
jgi:tRNA pseudouridine65 synthase